MAKCKNCTCKKAPIKKENIFKRFLNRIKSIF